jgi:hypothetical protein
LAHGQTEESLQDLRLAQIAGDVPRKKGNKNKEYTFPAHDAHLVHAEISTPSFNQQTGADESAKQIQVFGAQEFDQMERQQAFAGLKVTILHNPKDGDAEDVEPQDQLIPKVVSTPGAGIRTDMPLEKQNVEQLTRVHNDLFPGREAPKNKKELVANIQERLDFQADEERQKQLAAQSANQQGAADQGATVK